MKFLFSDTGLRVLESLSFTKTLYAFDFDGTLAPIVEKPENAKISKESANYLKQLAESVPTAIISGRSIADLRTKVKLPGNLLIGNHGVEGLGVKKEAISQAKETRGRWIQQINRDLKSFPSESGIFVEDKTYSIALHYRKSRNKKKTRLHLFSLIEKLRPSPRVILGKCVMNLLPSGGPHKGVALLEAMMKLDLKCALYVGDDDTDEDVFSLPDNRIITVRVGRKESSQAQFFIKRQSEMNRLLRLLIKIHQNGTHQNGI